MALRIAWKKSKSVTLVSTTSIHSEVAYPFMAEAHACSVAVNLSLSLRLERVEIEGDSLTVIKKCKNIEQYQSEIATIITNIQHLNQCFKEI